MPDLNPTVNYSDVTSGDIDTARNQANTSMRDAQEKQSREGIEVICPNCAHEFRVTGQ